MIRLTDEQMRSRYEKYFDYKDSGKFSSALIIQALIYEETYERFREAETKNKKAFYAKNLMQLTNDMFFMQQQILTETPEQNQGGNK